MTKFRSVEEYGFISRMFLRANLRAVQNDPNLSGQFINNEQPDSAASSFRQQAIEENLAARVARIHNGGTYRPASRQGRKLLGLHPDIEVVTRECSRGTGALCDINGRCVGNFLGSVAGRGEWRSLRCVDDLDNRLGLEMIPLIFK